MSRSDVNQSIVVRYGTVIDVEQVKLKSDVAKGAVAGGILGAVIGKDAVASAAIGAAAGGLLTKAAEGSNVAYSYTVDMVDGLTTKVVIESDNIRVGDCVVVEQGSSANIRMTSPVHCEHAGHPALDTPEVASKEQGEAGACHEAKQQALQAKTDQETDLAVKKVRALCES
ncbi:MAG: hypothetical protein OEU86_00395 [Gammaproteobacteria bacterium]|nr:hypothetical protein [Gammaproteobacteria bacterium]